MTQMRCKKCQEKLSTIIKLGTTRKVTLTLFEPREQISRPLSRHIVSDTARPRGYRYYSKRWFTNAFS